VKVTDLQPARFTDADLAEVESMIRIAQRTSSIDHMNVLGFGEVSVAVGYPTENPTAVFKRMVPDGTADGPAADLDGVRRFIAHIEGRGGAVVPTELRLITRDDDQTVVPYLVQPAVPKELMAETTLKTETPAVDHPILVAIHDYVDTVSTDDFTIDPQLANFAWDGERLSIFDISTPMIWDANGKLDMRLDGIFYALPSILEPVARKGIEDIMEYYRGTFGSLTQTCVFLKRMGLDGWSDAARETFNARLDKPIDGDEVTRRYESQIKEFPRIKQMTKIQRWWATKVRRREFEYIITDSFNGKVL